MKSTRILFISILAIAIFISCNKGEQESRTPKQYSSEQLRSNISVFYSDINQDETQLLVGSNQTGIYNAFLLNLADTTMQQLTHSTKETYVPASFVHGTSKYIIQFDEGGNENYHLHLTAVGDTTLKDLTPWPGSRNSIIGWDLDKKTLYFMSNNRDARFFDVWQMDTVLWKPAMLYQNNLGYSVGSVSKTGRFIALIESVASNSNHLYLFDRTTNKLTRISNDKEARWSPSRFEKNDSIFYYTTDDGGEFSRLFRYNINSGKSEIYFEDKWDVMGMGLSENEKYHVIYVNEDGKNKVLLFDHAANKQIDFPQIPDGDVIGASISPSEKKMILNIGSSTSPTNLFAYDFDNKELKQLTTTLNREVDASDLAKAQVVRYPSFDGVEIPAIYYKPLQASKKNKVPALVFVHGGPGGQSRVGYSSMIQFLVNKGYAVLAVNNRGSSGYGKTFFKMDNRDHGGGDLKDCIWGKKWLASQDYVDSTAIGIMGGSYGGNMVLNALCLYPDEFEVGVNLFGVANWLRTLRSIPAYWESGKKELYDEMGNPNSADSVRLKTVSPLYNYQKITKPLLVLQGANDVRVLQVESDEIVEGVRKNGVPVEYVLFPDEGHGFLKKENNITADNATLDFLEKYLRKKE